MTAKNITITNNVRHDKTLGFTVHGDIPWCNVCNRPVETVEWKHDLQVVHHYDSFPTVEDTGWMYVTVSCHGASIKMCRTPTGRWYQEN